MKKRLVLSLMTVALVALLASGATFALFTATATNIDNTFTAGTVTLGEPAQVTATIDVSNLAPGDADRLGQWDVQYTGSLDAWLALDASVSGDIFTGATPLEITLYRYDGNTLVGSPTLTSPIVNAQLDGLFEGGDGEYSHVYVDYNFPAAAGNSYQGLSGTLTMTVHAVQADNNTNTAGDGPISWN